MQPHGGLAGLPLVLVAAAFGAVIAAAIPHARLSLVAVALMTGLLLCTAYVQELRVEELPPPSGGVGAGVAAATVDLVRPPEGGGAPVAQVQPADAAAADRRSRPAAEQVAALRWRPQPPKPKGEKASLESMSIVLPCAFEGEFAEKTVNAIWANTVHSRIREILVVDDGSRPPLKTQFSAKLLSGGPGVAPVRIIRHERTMGLISAKKTGGDASVGDVIVFLDCHISPRKGWEEAFFRQMKRAGDYRTVVVPTITSLNPDTWEEIHDGANGQVCYVLWNSDFTWLARPGRDAPLMSGGLLAISRQWWQETEGYDEHMVAWGGENIDQSLRIWLCGGRIEVAEGAYIAHMWRDPKNPKTTLRYPIPTKDVMRNKARASKAWFGEFVAKVFSFPEYESFTKFGEPLGDMSNFERLQKKLSCKPFPHYIHRFSYVYLDTGLVPAEVFQIREKKTGLCLERQQKDQQPHNVVLSACGGGEGGGPAPELQLWHLGNRDRKRHGMPCCSGIMNWNFLQCMDAVSVGSKLRTFECEIQGSAANQHFALENAAGEGQFFWRPKGHNDGEGCLATVQAAIADASFAQIAECTSRVVPEGSGTVKVGPGSTYSAPARFRLKAPSVKEPGGACALAVGADGHDVGSNFQLQFQKCDPEDTGQVFRAVPMLGGLQIRVGETNDCLDAAGGGQLLVYPCYDESVKNLNQVFQIRNEKLVWQNGRGTGVCVGLRELPQKEERHSSAPVLRTCTPKVGQRLRRHDQDAEGTFLLKDVDGRGCLARLAGQSIGLGGCDELQRWRELRESDQVQHVASSMCIDAGGSDSPILYNCHRPRAGQKQRFQIVDEPGWVRLRGTWGDNGRKRWFEQCLDYSPEDPVDVTVQRCAPTRARGNRWERIHIHVPLERQLWDKAEKPPPGSPPLGGDAAPP